MAAIKSDTTALKFASSRLRDDPQARGESLRPLRSLRGDPLPVGFVRPDLGSFRASSGLQVYEERRPPRSHLHFSPFPEV